MQSQIKTHSSNAATEEIIANLIKNGADVNEKTKNGSRILNMVPNIANYQIDKDNVIDLLIENGATIDSETDPQIFFWACKNGNCRGTVFNKIRFISAFFLNR